MDGYQHFKGTHCLQKQVRAEKQQFSQVCGYLVTRLHVVTSHKTAVFSSLWISSYQAACCHIPQNCNCNNVHYCENLIYTYSDVLQMFYTVIGLAGKRKVFYLTVGCGPFSSIYFQVCAVFMHVHKIIT